MCRNVGVSKEAQQSKSSLAEVFVRFRMTKGAGEGGGDVGESRIKKKTSQAVKAATFWKSPRRIARARDRFFFFIFNPSVFLHDELRHLRVRRDALVQGDEAEVGRDWLNTTT